MIKRVFGRKLSRERATREALFVSLLGSLIENKSIVTTKAKAKAIVPIIDKLITLAKKDTLSSKRRIATILRGNRKVATILWTDISKVFVNRNGGFTRIINLPQRKGDLAKMVKMEFVEQIKEEQKEKVEKGGKGKEKEKENKKVNKKDGKNIPTKTKRN